MIHSRYVNDVTSDTMEIAVDYEKEEVHITVSEQQAGNKAQHVAMTFDEWRIMTRSMPQ